jgi:hypothetical protein
MGRLGNEWVNREMRFDLTIDRYARLYRRLAGTD